MNFDVVVLQFKLCNIVWYIDQSKLGCKGLKVEVSGQSWTSDCLNVDCKATHLYPHINTFLEEWVECEAVECSFVNFLALQLEKFTVELAFCFSSCSSPFPSTAAAMTEMHIPGDLKFNRRTFVIRKFMQIQVFAKQMSRHTCKKKRKNTQTRVTWWPS